MKPIAWAVLMLLLASRATAQTSTSDVAPATAEPASTHSGFNTSGKLRLQWEQRRANRAGPLAQANALQAGTTANTPSGFTLEAELRASGKSWNATATLQHQAHAGQSDTVRAWLNELAASYDGGSWHYSAGKKIVAWDVGYGFRPNDVVQQEQRRSLVSSTAAGRPVLMAEHYSADTAWSLVLVNPTKPKAQRGAQEPALAARVFQRQGAVDWHGFARVGAHTAGSLGAAVAWVAADALEVHASVRYLSRFDGKALQAATPAALQAQNPWQAVTARSATQFIAGGTWTHESQFSILAELWHDGTALSASGWRHWYAHNTLLARLPALGAPASAVAGNLAWQSEAFSASGNLHRNNVYVRLSWEHEGWQPTLDLLYHPADGGRMLTAALLWKGDRVQVQGGLRANGGPLDALVLQLPTRRWAYVAASWSF